MDSPDRYHLNKQVADVVFKTNIYSDEFMHKEAREVWLTQPACRVFLGGFDAYPIPTTNGPSIQARQHFPDYSGNMADAWKVVTKISSVGFSARYHFLQSLGATNPNNTLPEARFFQLTPEGICKAALEALGHLYQPLT